MNKHFPKKAKDIKGATAIAELQRAHIIIVLLALMLAMVIGFGASYDVRLNAGMSAIVILLLIFVAAVSFATILALRKR